MNEHPPSNEPDMPETAPAEASGTKAEEAGQATAKAPLTARPSAASSIARMGIMSMTLILVLALFGWQWFDAHRQIGDMRQELARRLSEMEAGNKASQMLVAREQEATRELAAKVTLLEAHYAEADNQRGALETLYRELSSSRDETTLAQVEQILLIASQQLQLSANVKAALIAMQQADDYLKRMDRPSLNGLRGTIERDMDKLRELPNVDVVGINLRLDNLIAAVDSLPLAQEIRVQQEAEVAAPAASGITGWQQMLHEIWDDAKRLVRIDNMEKQELPLISPTQTFFLRENLKLRLLSARLALLSHDETSYKHDLQAAHDWIALYFNAKSPEGKSALTSLKELHSARIDMELPDINASLSAVRNYRIAREKAAR